MKIAIIGTAGRDKSITMTRALWDWMLEDARGRIGKIAGTRHLVSGGAAWADHIAVALFLEGYVQKLTLHLPAPLTDNFDGPDRSAASAANYYHQRFEAVTGIDSIGQILEAGSRPGCDGSFEPAAEGYGAMFARNAKVAAAADAVLAYTFGRGAVPADGGTKNTWLMATCPENMKIHVSLPIRELA